MVLLNLIKFLDRTTRLKHGLISNASNLSYVNHCLRILLDLFFVKFVCIYSTASLNFSTHPYILLNEKCIRSVRVYTSHING